MVWRHTGRKLFPFAARSPRGERDGGSLARHRTNGTAAPDRTGRDLHAASLCVASGKGGTGKSVVTASLATLLSARGRTLLLDADLGVGNAHLLQDVAPERTIVDVVEGGHPLRDIVTPCSESIDLVAAGSGLPRMTELDDVQLRQIAAGIDDVEHEYRYLVVDSAAGISRQTLEFAAGCDLTLIVTTPDLTAMTDAYAFLKVLLSRTDRRPLLLVNRARDEREAERAVERILRVSDRFLGRTPTPIGWLPDDPAVVECVNRRGSVALLEPGAPFARALRQKAVRILEELGREHPRGLGRRMARPLESRRQRA